MTKTIILLLTYLGGEFNNKERNSGLKCIYRELGKSGLKTSKIGFGAWAIGGDAWGPVEDRNSITAMAKALDVGINFIDTADVYGEGHSEKLVAQVIKNRRDDIILSTKGGLMGHHRDPQRDPVYDTPQKVIDAFEASLRRLKTDYIDIYFCHIWWDNEKETEAFLRAFDTLKKWEIKAGRCVDKRYRPYKALQCR